MALYAMYGLDAGGQRVVRLRERPAEVSAVAALARELSVGARTAGRDVVRQV